MEKPWRRFVDSLWRRAEAGSEAHPERREAPVDASLRDSLLEAIHEIEAAYKSEGREGSLRTGFAGFDRLTSGSRPGELVVIASVPGMGKTVLALNVAVHVALQGKGAVVIFSLEGSRREMAQRILCSQAGVALQRVRSGGLSAERDFPRLQHAAARLAGAPIFVEDPARPSLGEVRQRLAELRKSQEVKLVVIDYVQSLCVSPDDEEEEAKVARELKQWAREFGVVILALAQLESPPAVRRGGRPVLADLKAGRAMERHADVVALLWRQDIFDPRPEEYDPDYAQASLILAKNRHGALGEVPLLFRKDVPRFENRALEGQGTGWAQP